MMQMLKMIISLYPDSLLHQGVQEDTFKLVFKPFKQNNEPRDPNKLAVYCSSYYFKSEAAVLSKEIQSSTAYKESCFSLAVRNKNPQILEILNEAIKNSVHAPSVILIRGG